MNLVKKLAVTTAMLFMPFALKAQTPSFFLSASTGKYFPWGAYMKPIYDDGLSLSKFGVGLSNSSWMSSLDFHFAFGSGTNKSGGESDVVMSFTDLGGHYILSLTPNLSAYLGTGLTWCLGGEQSRTGNCHREFDGVGSFLHAGVNYSFDKHLSVYADGVTRTIDADIVDLGGCSVSVGATYTF